jgi:hypothetical protein
MDATKEKSADSKLADLVESLKKYKTVENTGAVTGALGTDTMVYGGGYSTDTITIAPTDTITLTSPNTSWNTNTATIDFGNLSPNITIGGGTGFNYSNTTIGSGAGVYTIGSAVGANWNNTASGVMDLQGENADIKINGKSLVDTLTALEERLNILTPNPKLEAEWDELRELGERYRELEKQCKEKAEMWKKLKSMPAPTIT